MVTVVCSPVLSTLLGLLTRTWSVTIFYVYYFIFCLLSWLLFLYSLSFDVVFVIDMARFVCTSFGLCCVYSFKTENLAMMVRPFVGTPIPPFVPIWRFR